MFESKILILKFVCLLLISCIAKCSALEAEPYIECDFKLNDCGIKNQPNMGSNFLYSRANIGGRDQNMLILDISKAETQGARLVTPYFHTYNKIDACLTIEWYQNGDGVQSLSVIQQDKMDKKIWTSNSKSYDLQKSQINVDLSSGEPRFFIEANFEPKHKGTVAIFNLLFTYNRC